MRQQWKSIRRDGRLKVLAALLLLGSIAALSSGVARDRRLTAEREAAVRADADAWTSQGVVNPHTAAHFGRYVFKPITALSALDRGSLDHLGTIVRLEAHRQSPGNGRPADGGTVFERFSAFTVATALQVLAPLLVILMAFSTFSGERARSLLVQELGAGVRARVLLAGRLIALGAVIVAVVMPLGVLAAVVLLAAGAPRAEFARLALMVTGYALYLFALLTITIGVSALCRSTRSALTTLLAVWIWMTILVPRLAPAIVAHVRPAPSGAALSIGIIDEIDRELDGGGSRARRPERLTEMIIERYGVATVEDLPVDLSGALLEYGESQSTEVYRKHFAELYRTHKRQATLQRGFALTSPLIALQAWSAALAGTDSDTHHRFLMEAEAYRYAFVQHLNRDITLNRPGSSKPYATDVAEVTADIGSFEPSVVPLSDVWRRQWLDLAILVGWTAAGLGFALACTRVVDRAA